MQRRAPNLADAFRGGVTPTLAAVAPETVLPTPKFQPAPVPTESNVTSWVRANWGKTVALVLIVLVSVIFIVRTTLVARNRKRVAAEERRMAAAGGSDINWDSFFDGPAEPPLRQVPLSPLQQMQMQQQVHHRPQPAPQAPRLEGLTPLPPPPPPHNGHHGPPPHHGHHGPPPSHHAPPPPQNEQTRGVQHRMPPADSPLGGGAMAMPESTRPIRQTPTPSGGADATFVIGGDDLPVTAAAPEVEPKKKGEGEQPPLQPPSTSTSPSGPPASTDFTRL